MALNEDIDYNALAPMAADKGNPYRLSPYDGDILPSTYDGLKLYLAATKSLDEDKRWALNVQNGLTIKSRLLQAAPKFFWESVVIIPLMYNTRGTPSHFINIIGHPENVDISHTRFHKALACSTPDYSTLIVHGTTIVDIDPMNNETDRPTFQL